MPIQQPSAEPFWLGEYYGLPTNTLAMQDTLRDKERASSPPNGAPAEATGSRFTPQSLN